MAESAALLRVVGIHASRYQLAPVEWPVVCVRGRPAAWICVPVCRVAADAGWILAEYACAEGGAVPAGVATLGEGAALAVALLLTLRAAASHWIAAARAGVGCSRHDSAQDLSEKARRGQSVCDPAVQLFHHLAPVRPTLLHVVDVRNNRRGELEVLAASRPIPG